MNNISKLVAAVLWLAAALVVGGMAFAEGQQAVPKADPLPAPSAASTVPVLTTEQKFQVRDLQAKDGEVTTAILQSQLQATQRIQQLSDQKKGYEDQLNRLVSTLCEAKDGKRYQLNPSDLTCTPVPEPPKPATK